MKRKLLTLIALILSLVLLFTLVSCDGGGSESKEPKRNTCKSCDRSWQAGDANGNFMSIAKTGMCKNCYNNYQWAQKESQKYGN